MMKRRLLLMLSCILLTSAMVLAVDPYLPANPVTNPNFELDETGAVNLNARPFSECLAWDGWGNDTRVVPHDGWGQAHPTALMAARIGYQNNNSVWQETGVIGQADTVYTFSADIKSEWSWQMELRYKTVGAESNTKSKWFTPQHHTDWRTKSFDLDTSVDTAYVGKEILIEVVCHDWDWGRIYAANIQLVATPLNGAYDPDPADQATGIGAQDGSFVDVTLAWKAGKDPNDIAPLNPEIKKHYLYMSKDLTLFNDPNLYYVTAIDQVSATDPNVSITMQDLNYDGTYKWMVEEGLDNKQGGAYVAGDPNNIIGSVWTFDSLASIPVITSQPANILTDLSVADQFEITVDSISTPSYQWFKSMDNANDTPGDDTTLGTSNIQAVSGVLAEEGYYFCVVSNASGTNVASNMVRMAVRRLMAHWTLDALVSDQYVDSSSEDPVADNADPNNPTGGIQFPADGQVDQAVTIDNNSFANAGTSLSPTQYSEQLTVSAWIRITNPSAMANTDGYGIVGKGTAAAKNASNWVWSFYARDRNNDNNPSVRLLSWNGGDAWSAGGAVPVNEWVHVAATVEAGKFATIYVNGLQSGYTDDSFTYGNDLAGPVLIGTYGTAVTEDKRLFPGDIDEIKVYNYGMDKFGIADLYNEASGENVCIADYDSTFDLTGPEGVPDCKIDLLDLAGMASTWLDCGLYPNCP